jgi:uncharacterized membrane protein
MFKTWEGGEKEKMNSDDIKYFVLILLGSFVIFLLVALLIIWLISWYHVIVLLLKIFRIAVLPYIKLEGFTDLEQLMIWFVVFVISNESDLVKFVFNVGVK